MLDSGSVVDVGFVLLYLELINSLEYTQPIPIWIYVLFLYTVDPKKKGVQLKASASETR